MMGKAALFLLSIVIVGSVMPAGGCGGSDHATGVTATLSSQGASPTSAEAVSRETLRKMIPADTGLTGFTLSGAGFSENEDASAEAPDPAARLARLNEMGRIVGFHALFVPGEGAPADAPDAILWSVNLFQQPAGALEFINEPPDVPEGEALVSLDVGTLGPNAVGFEFRNSDAAKPASGYTVAFAKGTVQASVTALYKGTGFSPDYTLSLGQQALSLVEGAMQGGSAPQAPLEGAPTDMPGGITVPMRAVVGTPEE